MRRFLTRSVQAMTTLAGLLLAANAVELDAQSTAAPARLGASRQLIVVTTPDWNSTSGELRRFMRPNLRAPWRPVGGRVPIVVGRSGLAWGDSGLAAAAADPVKHEGDGRAPAGVFSLDTAFGFATRAEMPWVQLPYTSLQPGSDCVDDTSSAHYNTVVDRGAVQKVDWNSAEHMRSVSQYRLGVIVGYNAAPPRRGRGSCIFLHIWSGSSSSTAGCTAMEASELETVMRWLDKSRRPTIVQLPAASYHRLRGAWRLPAV